MYFRDETANLINRFDEKQIKQLRLPELLRMIDKLIEQSIEDEAITQSLIQLRDVLTTLQNDWKQKRYYMAAYNALKKEVQTKYKLVPKGYYTAIYMSFGMSIGTGLGVALMSATNTAFLSVGIGCGLAIGAGIGAAKEKEAESKGLVY